MTMLLFIDFYRLEEPSLLVDDDKDGFVVAAD
jgi:hypothetical protein